MRFTFRPDAIQDVADRIGDPPPLEEPDGA